jgi:fatty acid desaturase
MYPERMSTRRRRQRLVYAGILGLTVAFGLATRWAPAAFPALVATYGGDALWAAAVFWLLAVLLPRARTAALAGAAAVIALAIEVSQLYHAPWIDAVRATRPGGLALGHGFLWSDLVCYAAGIALAALIDVALRRARR